MLKDYFKFVLNNFVKRKTRSLLTIIGIFIGIAAVVAMVSLGQGMQQAINTEFEKAGANRIIITAGGMFFGPTGGSLSTTKLTEEDVEVVRDTEGIEEAYGIVSETTQVTYKGDTEYVSVWGLPTNTEALRYIESIGFFDIEKGRDLKQNDRYVAILGNKIAFEIFDREVRLRDRIEIEGKEFRVIGIQKKAGTVVHDILIRIPKDVAIDIFEKEDEVDTIFARSKENYEISEVADRVKEELADFRGLEEGEEDFSVQTSQQSIENFNSLLNIVQIFLVGIAFISLIVGGVGIMNTMYTSVMERTPEIGIMKAIGAKNSDVMWIFLIESGLLGMIGGAIGITLGLMLSKLVEVIAISSGLSFFKSYMGLPLILGALFFSFIVGALSGMLPARQAALMNPVDALQKTK
jgi:putative ABC transport system permease protein